MIIELLLWTVLIFIEYSKTCHIYDFSLRRACKVFFYDACRLLNWMNWPQCLKERTVTVIIHSCFTMIWVWCAVFVELYRNELIQYLIINGQRYLDTIITNFFDYESLSISELMQIN